MKNSVTEHKLCPAFYSTVFITQSISIVEFVSVSSTTALTSL